MQWIRAPGVSNCCTANRTWCRCPPANNPLADRAACHAAGRSARTNPFCVKIITPRGTHNAANVTNRRPIIMVTVPVVRGTQLVTTFYRPPSPPWPMETFDRSTGGDRHHIHCGCLYCAACGAPAVRTVRRRDNSRARRRCGARAGRRPGRCAPRGSRVQRYDRSGHAHACESQRQLLSAVGHDLRTPITAMRINIEFVKMRICAIASERNLAELQELTEAFSPPRRARAANPNAMSIWPRWSKASVPTR